MEEDTRKGAPPDQAPRKHRYKEQYGIIIVCDDENEQAQVYMDLWNQGYRCKVVVT